MLDFIEVSDEKTSLENGSLDVSVWPSKMFIDYGSLLNPETIVDSTFGVSSLE